MTTEWSNNRQSAVTETIACINKAHKPLRNGMEELVGIIIKLLPLKKTRWSDDEVKFWKDYTGQNYKYVNPMSITQRIR